MAVPVQGQANLRQFHFLRSGEESSSKEGAAGILPFGI